MIAHQNDPIRQVAEMPCPLTGFRDPDAQALHDHACRTCQGTRRRWPELSRDVTMDKVLEELISIEGEVVVGKGGNGPGMNDNFWGYYVRVGDDPPVMFEEKTLLEALCAALLATVEA